MAFNPDIFAKLWANHSIPTARIAEAMGITRQGASWHAHRMGLPSRAKLRLTKHDPVLLAEMWNAGVSTDEIAAHFGMAHNSCAGNAARRLGLPPRVRGASGKHNGGWVGNLPIAAFFEQKLAARMAETARIEQAQIKLAEMWDQPGHHTSGKRKAA